MPHRPGELCEKCCKHIHPQTAASFNLIMQTHSASGCAKCLPPGVLLITCGGCKLTRYCGKACQKAHRPVHKESCDIEIRIKQCARSYGPETEAMHTSFTQWCEDNSPAFSKAAFSALEISLDRQNTYEYILLVFVWTDSRNDDTSNKLRFTHSILTAKKESRKFMHDANDISMGSPEMVDKCILSPSTSVTRVIVQNISLPRELRSYTLTFISDDHHENAKYPKFPVKPTNPKWFELLKNSVK